MKKGWGERMEQWTITHVPGSQLACWCISQLVMEQIQYFVFRHPYRWHVYSQAQTQLGDRHFLSDQRTLKHCLMLKPNEYLPMWVALLSKMPLKKEVELLGRELVPFVDRICVQGAGLFTIFLEKCFKSRVKSRKGIKAVQELITTINFAETSWCFADSLVLFW